MGKRVTIILDEKVYKKLRFMQARLIHETKDSVSFSETINEVILAGLKNGNSRIYSGPTGI